MTPVNLEDWPESKEHGKAVSRVIHVSMTFEDGHIETADTVEILEEGQQECCPPPCNPLIDPLCS